MKLGGVLLFASAVLVASVFAAYDWTKVPLTRVAPPFRVLYPSGVTAKDSYDTWFCSYLAFNPITWNFPVAATQFTGYVSLSGAKAITTVSSLFNDVASVSSKTSASATFYARIGSYQQQYTAKTDMRFFVCGSKDAAVKYSDIKWTAMLIMTTDMRPPPPPVPGWKGFTLGTTTNVTSCYPGVYPDVLKWDILLSQHLVNAERARIGGKVAAGGNVFTNLLEGKIGIDYPDCAASCNGGMSDIFLMAGNYIVFNKPSPGICRGFMQGNATISTQSQLTVASGCPAITGSFPLDMTSIKTNWIAWAIFLKNKQPTAVCGYALDPLVGGTLNLVFNNKFPELIWWLPGDFLTEAGVFSINAMNPELVADAKTIIFNIAGAQVIFGLDFSYYFAEVGDRVIFNFYEATKVMFQSGTYVGTVLAPFADVSVYGGSSVYGQIFSKTLVVIGSEVRTFDKKWSGFTTYTGTCLSCAPNFYGPNCQACSCKYNEICNDGPQGDGSCRCMDNFNPTCTDCKTGFYGKFCNKTCTTTCVTRGTCSDGINGTGACLSCDEPFDGKECTNCIDTVYGPNCDKDCQSVCFIRGGTCDFGVNGTGLCKNCSDPYANGPLKLCDECSNGFYGPDCSLQCSETCAKNGICSSGIEGTGECLSCKPKFVGAECEECISGLWGANCTNCTRSCLLYGTCNDGASGDGSCSNCADGITGPQCNECAQEGYYGPNCDKKCSETCLKNGKCSSGPLGTGTCLSCKPRFKGKNCENAGTTAKASLAILIGLILLLLGLAY